MSGKCGIQTSEGYQQALCEVDSYALETKTKATNRERQAYESGKYERQTFWHATARTAELFHGYCLERLEKESEDTK